jgi:long-chain acyl-CoA synthetase
MDSLTIASLDSYLVSVKNAYWEQSACQIGDIASICNSWRRHGLRPGDIVVIAMPNSVDLLWQMFGVLAAEGVPALVSPSTPSSQLRDILNHFSARAIVSLRPGLERSDSVEHFTVNGIQAMMFEPSASHETSPGEVIILTSGTSGFASGCVFELDALMLNATRHADAIGLRADDTVLVNLPLHYSFALVAQVLAAWIRGARLVISGPPFHVPSYLALLIRGEVTVSSLTPILVRRLLQYGHRLPDNLRVLTVGGDMLASYHVEQLIRLHPDHELYVTYGLTEAGPRVSTLAVHQEPAYRFASAGLPLQGTRVMLDDASASVGPRELLVSSETLMKRRIGLVEGRSRNDWRGRGFIATGDVFDLDEDGYLYFRGRLSDFLEKEGEKVCLASVRRIATSFPGVVAARTQPFAEAEDENGFDLTVSVIEALGIAEKDLQLGLRRSLRRSEWPRHINVVPLKEKSPVMYK